MSATEPMAADAVRAATGLPPVVPSSPPSTGVSSSFLPFSAPATPSHGRGPSAVWPILALSVAVLGGFTTQTWQLLEDRAQLLQVQQAQQAQVDASTRIRASLDALANATARLAAAGNVGAATVVKALRDRGITINAPAD